MRTHSRPQSRPLGVVETPSLQFRTIHGYRRAFRVAGSGPALLLIHGVGDNSTTWDTVHAALARRFTVIAPDLLGHGESDKPRADYSLAAFANGMRDLLAVLGIDRVTVVGHSLGGGIAMQFAYQYPHMVERVALVSTGGVTKDVSFGLRLAAMPFGAEALGMLRLPGAMPAIQLVGRIVEKRLGSTTIGRDLPRGLDLFGRLQRPGALSAFARTLRGVVDGHGQFVSMLDRSYLMQSIPLQLIWGEDDIVIPVEHARIAHEEIHGSRLEIFEDSGHLPHRDHPARFVQIVEEFIDSTEPGDFDPDRMRSELQTGMREIAATVADDDADASDLLA